MFYFLIKNLSRVTWTVLAVLLSHITYDVQSVFSVHWQTVRCLSKFQSACNVLSFMLSVLWNTISVSSFSVKHFADITSRGHLHHTVLLYAAEFILISSSGFTPNQPISSMTLQRFYTNLTSSIISNYSTALPLLLASSFSMIRFVKCYRGLSLEPRRQHSGMLCSLCKN